MLLNLQGSRGAGTPRGHLSLLECSSQRIAEPTLVPQLTRDNHNRKEPSITRNRLKVNALSTGGGLGCFGEGIVGWMFCFCLSRTSGVPLGFQCCGHGLGHSGAGHATWPLQYRGGCWGQHGVDQGASVPEDRVPGLAVLCYSGWFPRPPLLLQAFGAISGKPWVPGS